MASEDSDNGDDNDQGSDDEKMYSFPLSWLHDPHIAKTIRVMQYNVPEAEDSEEFEWEDLLEINEVCGNTTAYKVESAKPSLNMTLKEYILSIEYYYLTRFLCLQSRCLQVIVTAHPFSLSRSLPLSLKMPWKKSSILELLPHPVTARTV